MYNTAKPSTSRSTEAIDIACLPSLNVHVGTFPRLPRFPRFLTYIPLGIISASNYIHLENLDALH